MAKKLFGFIDKRPKIIAHYFILSALLFLGYFVAVTILNFSKIDMNTPTGWFWLWIIWGLWLLITDNAIHTYIIKED